MPGARCVAQSLRHFQTRLGSFALSFPRKGRLVFAQQPRLRASRALHVQPDDSRFTDLIKVGLGLFPSLL